MNFLIENKWIFLIILEILAWASTFFMLYARYGLRSNRMLILALILSILTGVIPQVTLGIINFIHLQKIDLFTIAILALILYGLTLGKKHTVKLDRWIQKKFNQQNIE